MGLCAVLDVYHALVFWLFCIYISWTCSPCSWEELKVHLCHIYSSSKKELVEGLIEDLITQYYDRHLCADCLVCT